MSQQSKWDEWDDEIVNLKFPAPIPDKKKEINLNFYFNTTFCIICVQRIYQKAYLNWLYQFIFCQYFFSIDFARCEDVGLLHLLKSWFINFNRTPPDGCFRKSYWEQPRKFSPGWKRFIPGWKIPYNIYFFNSGWKSSYNQPLRCLTGI